MNRKALEKLTNVAVYGSVAVALGACGPDELVAPVGADDAAPAVGDGPTFSDPPVVGEGPTFSDLDVIAGGFCDVSVTVGWTAATDDMTDAAALRYRVVWASSTDELDTLAEAGQADEVMPFTAGALSFRATNLDGVTPYAFAVIVEDEAQRRALYPPQAIGPVDTTPPTGGTVSFAAVTSADLWVQWSTAQDNCSFVAGIAYKVVMAADPTSIDSLAEIAAITTAPGLVTDWVSGAATAHVSGLTTGTTYAFNVVARDGVGNETLYTPATVTTP